MIVRVARPERWTTLPNDLLRDQRLSWKARGLLAHLLSMPPGWMTSSDRLARLGPDGRDAVRSGLAELERAGYVSRIRRQSRTTGRWSTELVVRDVPDRTVDTARPPVDNLGDDMGTTDRADAGLSDVGKPGALGTTEHEVLNPHSSTETTEGPCTTCKGSTYVLDEVDEFHVEPCPRCRP